MHLIRRRLKQSHSIQSLRSIRSPNEYRQAMNLRKALCRKPPFFNRLSERLAPLRGSLPPTGALFALGRPGGETL